MWSCGEHNLQASNRQQNVQIPYLVPGTVWVITKEAKPTATGSISVNGRCGGLDSVPPLISQGIIPPMWMTDTLSITLKVKIICLYHQCC